MVFSRLDKHFGSSNKRWSKHTTDCFASFANTQIPSKLYTRFPDPSHMKVDFFRQSLGEDNNYINPPWNLLSRVVEHVVHHSAVATVVAPYWPRQSWFQRLKALSTHPPVFLCTFAQPYTSWMGLGTRILLSNRGPNTL
jgi:hypothetical protein